MTPIPGALAAYGCNERVLALFRDLDDGRLELARVVRVDRSRALAVGADGDELTVRAPILPAVGDWVALEHGPIATGPAPARLVAVLSRWSAIRRIAPDGEVQLIAADVDLVLVTAPADRVHAARVERELALAWESGATPLVLLTKCDLAPAGAAGELAGRLAGSDLLEVSARSGAGIEELRRRLRPDRTAVLIGPSGAGKSSLLNLLAERELTATGAVRDLDRRGRHTTTARQLVALEGGGVLIDTPGLRSLALPGGAPLGRVFPEVEELAGRCRFRDCRHDHEPGCAVAQAIAAGELLPERLRSFRKLDRELAAEARRSDPAERRAALERWKAASKTSRLHDKRLGR